MKYIYKQAKEVLTQNKTQIGRVCYRVKLVKLVKVERLIKK